MHKEETTGTQPIFDGRIVRLRVDDALLENGTPVKREVVEHPGGVCVVAVDAQDRVYLVRQFRYPFGKELIELPAGKLEYGEDPFACGLRELKEETGCQAKDYRFVGAVYPSPAYLSEVIHIYYASGLSEGGQRLDEDEFLSVLRVPFDEAVRMVMEGEIYDAKTQIGLLRIDALRRQGKL